jgi:hypothetical protein
LSRARTLSEQASVDKYLIPGEVRLATVRRHSAVLIAPVTEAAGVLLVSLLISFALHEERAVQIAVWLITAIVLLGSAFILLNWAVRYYVITSLRVMVTSGLGARTVTQAPLSSMADSTLRRPYAGRLLGYGTIRSKSGDVVLDYIPYPEQIYLILCARNNKEAIRDYGAERGDVVEADDEDLFDGKIDDTYILDSGDSDSDN